VYPDDRRVLDGLTSSPTGTGSPLGKNLRWPAHPPRARAGQPQTPRYERSVGLLRSAAVISMNCSARPLSPGSVRSVSGTEQAAAALEAALMASRRDDLKHGRSAAYVEGCVCGDCRAHQRIRIDRHELRARIIVRAGAVAATESEIVESGPSLT